MKRRLLGALSLVLLSLAALPGVQLAHAQPVFEANVTFPEQRDIANPPVFREEGNQVSGTRVVALPRIDDLDLHLVVNPNQLVDRADCEMRLEVKINDVAAGTVTVRAGQQAVDAFLRPAESVQPVVSGANNNYTFLLRVAATPPAGCGTITLPWRPQASTWHLEVEDVPGNARPRGTIGGPYQVNEGGSVPMAAAGTDPEGEQLTFAWDFDGDGQFDDGQGAAAVFDARAIDGPVQQPVKLRLSDAGGAFRELQTTVTVRNVAPAFDRSVLPDNIGVLDIQYSYTPRVLDPCPQDTFTFSLLRRPDGMTVGQNGLVQWTPSQAQVDRLHAVKLKVDDDNGDSDLLEWDVRVVSDPNTPFVNAGEDRTTDPGCIELVCEGADPRGRDLAYHWELVQGPAMVVFSDQDAPVTIAVVSTAGNYKFSCTATERVPEEDVPLTSPPDEVTISVRNLPPLADPGFTTFGKTKQRITLDGRRSIDPNSDALRYRWEQTAGDTVRISGFTNQITSFYPTSTDIYCFTLTVQDAEGLASAPAEICVVVNEPGDKDRCERDADCRREGARCRPVAGEEFNRCEPAMDPDYNPLAWAGEDQWALVGDNVQLKGMRSYDPDGEQPFLEEYLWAPCSPLAEQAVLNGQGTMMPSFTPEQPGRYCWSLEVRDGNQHRSMPDMVWVMVETADNRAPWADARAGIAVHIGEEVLLDGTQSRDPDGDQLSFSWRQLRGIPVALDDRGAAVARFCAAVPGIYQFQLVVDDGEIEGVSDEVWVTVTSPCNEAPVAKAGANFTVLTDDGDPETLQDRAVLDGRQTYDPDPAEGLVQLLDGLKFQWVQIGGLPLDLQLPFTRRPWFRTTKWGLYTFRLFVLDAWPEGEDPRHPLEPPDCWVPAWSLPDDVVVTVNDPPGGQGNSVPMADAGPELVDCLIGEECFLDGRGSVDLDGDDLHFRWEQIAGSPLVLAAPDSATPHFAADELGEWVFRLIVSDGYIESLPDEVKVKVRPNDNQAPICRAGRDQSEVTPGSPVVLNGCGSLDMNGDPLTYVWSQLDGPPVEDLVQGVGQDECKAFFVAPEVQQTTSYTFQLVASDGRTECEADAVVITVVYQQVCDPEDTRVCTCEDTGYQGTRHCLPNGQGWSPECKNCRAPCACVANQVTNCICADGGRGKRTCSADCLTQGECTDCTPVDPGEGEGEGAGTKGGDDEGGCSFAAGAAGAADPFLPRSSLLGLLLGLCGLPLLRRR